MKIGDKVFYTQNDYGVGKDNPLFGTSYQCEGTITELDRENWFIVKWDNDQTNSFQEHTLTLTSDVVNNSSNSPYLTITKTITIIKYNPNYGDDRICECGHTYYRHFDPYEHMEPVGCKYCDCYEFKERSSLEEDLFEL